MVIFFSAILAALFLAVTFIFIRGFHKNLGMNVLQSTTLGLLIWAPLSLIFGSLLFSIGTDIVLIGVRSIAQLFYKLVCGLSGTTTEEVEELHKKYLQKAGKK